jgi:hypothetical protein
MKKINAVSIALAFSAALTLPANMGAFTTQSENANGLAQPSACADIPDWVPKRSEKISKDGTISECNTVEISHEQDSFKLL